MMTYGAQQLLEILHEDINTYQVAADHFQLKGEFGSMERFAGKVEEAKSIVTWINHFADMHEI